MRPAPRAVGVLVLGMVVLSACTAPVTPAGARRMAADVPVPPGAVVLSEDSRFSPLEGPGSSKAERVYSVPTPIDVACPAILRLAMGAGYTAIRPDIGVDLPPVTDPEAACAEDRERSRLANGGGPVPFNTMTIFPRGTETRNQSDGIGLVTAPPQPGDPFPTGSRLRVQV